MIFTAGPPIDGAWYDSAIVAQSLQAGDRREVVRGAAQARYAASGHLVYARAGTLFAVPFDVNTLSVTGEAVPVVRGVWEDPSSGRSLFALSSSGALAYVPGGLQATDVVLVDRHGQASALTENREPRFYYQPRLSPDGSQLAVVVASGDDDVWVYDVGSQVLDRFTRGANHGFPTWTPDGRRIAFLKWDTNELLVRSANRSGQDEVVPGGPYDVPIPQSWSPDGSALAFTPTGATTGYDIWLFHPAEKASRPLLNGPFTEWMPAFSPDGRWLAYASNESGRFEVYVQAVASSGERWQVSRAGGSEPVWARKGDELFYRQADSLMALAMANGRPQGAPQELFSPDWWPQRSSRASFDVLPDGSRFVMIRQSESARHANRIHVVQNFFEELKRLAPP
jgi:dipeptidyl aminopeptidase/acylaminoacyl peptidase